MKNSQSLPFPHPKKGNVETIHTTSPVVMCNGGNDVLGHPNVYLKISQGQIFCPYCSKLYILDEANAQPKMA